MSNSALVSKFMQAYSGNYTKGRNTSIKKITVHHTAGVISIEQLGNLWATKGRRGSSHYGIGNDGRIGQYVNESDTAWTDSNWNSNCQSVTIETSNNKTGGDWTVGDSALNSLIKLVADIAKRNGLGKLVPGKNLTWHSMYASTACPGNYLKSKMQYIADEANKINNNQPAPQPKPTPQPSSFLPSRGYFKSGDNNQNVAKIADFMYRTFPAYTKKAALGPYYGPNLIASIKEFQRRTGLTPDGCTGPLTLSKMRSYGFKY